MKKRHLDLFKNEVNSTKSSKLMGYQLHLAGRLVDIDYVYGCSNKSIRELFKVVNNCDNRMSMDALKQVRALIVAIERGIKYE